MEFTSEQINEIRNQLISQINSSYPEDKKKESIDKFSSMPDNELIDFLKKSGAIKNPGENPGDGETNCIFCAISSGNSPSVKISEDNNSMAVLEINPLSEGHTIVIPREHSNMPSKDAEEFADKVKEQIKKTLNPKDVVKENSELFGHAIINLIPVYGDTLETERKNASNEELQKIKDKIQSAKPEIKKEIPKEPSKKEEIGEDVIIPKRIP